MRPGPELASTLAGLDRSRLAAEDLHDLLAARARLIAHLEAEFMADLYETGLAAHQLEGSLERRAGLDRFAADEVAMTLHQSREWICGQLAMAQDLIKRLPAVYEALRAGRIDKAKAETFSASLCLLSDDNARKVADICLEAASGQTLKQLQNRLRYWAHKVDPDLARERYINSVANRRVSLTLNDDGTAELSGINLPPDRAVAGNNNLDRLARAARREGDIRTLNQLRTDVFLSLVEGRPFHHNPPRDGLTDEADRAAHLEDDPDDLAGPQPPPPPRRRAPRFRTVRRPTTDPPADGGKADGERAGSGNAGKAGADTPSAPPEKPTGQAAAGATPAGGPPEDDWFWPTDPPPDDDGFWPADAPDLPADRDPAGPDASTNASTDAGWVAGAGGGGERGVKAGSRRGTVDIQLTLATLVGLNNDPGLIPGFGPVLADIARQIAYDQQQNPAWKYSATDRNGDLLHHGHTQRRPTATEKAFAKARDRYCRIPGCRRVAIDCEDDHRQEHAARNGPSHRGNICNLCKAHHVMRHLHGYTATHLGGATYLWVAPNGRLYIADGKQNLNLAAESYEPEPPPPQDEHDELYDLIEAFGTATIDDVIDDTNRTITRARREAALRLNDLHKTRDHQTRSRQARAGQAQSDGRGAGQTTSSRPVSGPPAAG